MIHTLARRISQFKLLPTIFTVFLPCMPAASQVRPQSAAQSSYPIPGIKSDVRAAEGMANRNERLLTKSDDLSSAERLAIKFLNNPELTGEYRISSDNTISIPVIGRVSVVDFDAVALEKALGNRVMEVSGKEGYVTVEVAAYKPLFVTGYVKNPGAIQWRPGITVLQAVALSGGTPRELRLDGQLDASRQETERAAKALDSQKRTLAALARARAEQRGADTVEIPRELLALGGRAEAENLIQRERAMFESRRSSLATQASTLERGIKLAGEELDALKLQEVKLSEQLKQRRDYSGRMRELLTKGVVAAERSIEADLRVTDLEEKITNIKVAMARVQSTIAALERDSNLLRAERVTSVQYEVSRLEREAAQLQLEIDAIAPGRMSAVELRDPSGSEEPPFRIVRRDSGTGTATSADEATSLLPGDVLVVAEKDPFARLRIAPAER